MLHKNETALICDFAETYHVLDLRGLPLRIASALAVGLRENSRIKMILNGTKVQFETQLKALEVDYLALLWWAKTEDGHASINRPKSIYAAIVGDEKKIKGFDSAEDFKEAFNKIAKRG